MTIIRAAVPLLASIASPLLAGMTTAQNETTSNYVSYDPPATPPHSCFEKGRWSVELLYQGFGSFTYGGEHPVINYGQASLRAGRMMSDIHGDGFWRGNSELILEGLYAEVTHGPGEWIGGGNVIWRRNFVPGDGRFSWYVQLGGGLVWNDIYKDYTQTLVGRSREFSLLAGAGMRYQFHRDWFFLLEADYRHISNADTAPRNSGLDAIGAGLGVGRVF